MPVKPSGPWLTMYVPSWKVLVASLLPLSPSSARVAAGRKGLFLKKIDACPLVGVSLSGKWLPEVTASAYDPRTKKLMPLSNS